MRSDEPIGTPLKVLYIAGSGRSGSTLLGDVLAQYSQHFHAGELYKLLTVGTFDNLRCGCERPALRCDVWRPILANVEDPYTLSSKASRLLAAGSQLRILLGLVAPSTQETLQAVREAWQHLTQNIAQHTGCRVLIDSSKLPLIAYLTSQLPGVDLYVVHLVRDPRGVAYSWTTRTELPLNDTTIEMRRRPPLSSAWNWITRNLGVLLVRPFARHLTVRYEDFVAAPAEWTRSILAFIEEQPRDEPFLEPHLISLRRTHTVHGNPVRFSKSALVIRRDDRWERAMPRRDRAAVTVLTLPMMLYFGYTP